MLSALSRGYSPWNGDLDVYGEAFQAKALPEVGPGGDSDRHKHGVTVTPRNAVRPHPYASQAQPQPPSSKEDGCLDLPKTYLTRKGALLLFTAPDAPPEKDHVRPRMPRKRKQQDLIDLSLKLGTLERLSLSVLQYGDQTFDRENSSISDKENRWFLKFLHQLNPPEPLLEEESDPLTDHRAQPGADVNFYLQDLKQRASSRCYGRESSLSSRARSQELRDILQQLEETWPSGHAQPLSQAPTSYSDGSFHGNDEFLYPRSPSLSSESSRTFSGRAKVLSSHRLTASLKSLNYLGRPPSTDPGDQARSLASPDTVVSHGQLSHTRRSRSGYWSGTPDLPTDLRKRPGSSHYGSRRSSSLERQLMTTPDMSVTQEESVPVIEEEGGDGRSSRGSQAISVRVSSSMGFTVDGGSERAHTGRVSEEDGDRASMSSSLQQEDDIILPSDGEEGDADSKRGDWPELGEGGLTKPLQPQYSGVMQDSEMLQEEDKLRKSEQGSRPGSRPGSVASMRSRDVYRPSSVMSSRAASRAGMLPEEEEEVDQEGLDELMAQGSDPGRPDSSQRKMDEILLDHVAQQLEKQEKYAASISGSVDQPEQDPETLVSLQGGGTVVSSSSVKSGSDTHNESLQRLSMTPEPRAVSPLAVASKAVSPAVTPEPDTASVAPEIKTAEETETESMDIKPTSDAEQVIDSALSNIDVTEEGKALSEADVLSMAMSEAGFRAVPSPLPPSRSQTPVPAVTATVSVADEPSKAVPEPAVSEPAKTELPQPAKETKQPEKVADVKKTDVKEANKKPPLPPRAKSPTKGGKADKKAPSGKTFVKAMDISSVKPDKAEAEAGAPPTTKAKDSPKKQKESYRPPPPPPRPKTPADKPNLLIPEHMKEAMERSNTRSQNELDNELLQMRKVMDDALGQPMRLPEDTEGLTEEELQQAQQALKERMEEAQRKMQEAVLPDSMKPKSPSTPRKQQPEAKGRKGKKVRVEDPKVAEEKAKKEAAKEQRRLERQKRLEEAKALQEMIKQKESARKQKEEEAALRKAEMEEQVEIMRAEEDAIQQAEEDAREQMAQLRKIQREEREARRKADLEKKKQDALARREKEKQMMEDARRKEQEMLERIADAEMRRAIREEEERKRDEEDRLAQERYEEELHEAQLQAEEEERRLQELERQAEEEAFQRIIAEREEAERQREELELQARRMAEEEERVRQQMLEEEKRLEEERVRHEAEEEKRKEEERQRLKELQRMEEEAREKMRAEIEQRREWALKRREVNLDRRKNLDGLRQTQGMTEPWIFSYFIQWPRETYCRPMGLSAQDQKGKRPAKPKKK